MRGLYNTLASQLKPCAPGDLVTTVDLRILADSPCRILRVARAVDARRSQDEGYSNTAWRLVTFFKATFVTVHKEKSIGDCDER